ncbi:MAG: hypothetical protein ACOYKE_13325 [Ferruginibacter sp.]
MKDFKAILKGTDLRSIGASNAIVPLVTTQAAFNQLFQLLKNSDRKLVMHAADAIEKITIQYPQFLLPHQTKIIEYLLQAKHIELKWHLALLVARLPLSEEELGIVWQTLTHWATDVKESRIVRVNALQGLFTLLSLQPDLITDFSCTLSMVEPENIPSIQARIRRFKKHPLLKNMGKSI